MGGLHSFSISSTVVDWFKSNMTTHPKSDLWCYWNRKKYSHVLGEVSALDAGCTDAMLAVHWISQELVMTSLDLWESSGKVRASVTCVRWQDTVSLSTATPAWAPIPHPGAQLPTPWPQGLCAPPDSMRSLGAGGSWLFFRIDVLYWTRLLGNLTDKDLHVISCSTDLHILFKYWNKHPVSVDCFQLYALYLGFHFTAQKPIQRWRGRSPFSSLNLLK